MTQAELLQVQLQIAIKNNRGAKQSRSDYPGYWLYVIEEQLSKADRRGILSNLKLSAEVVRAYKRVFTNTAVQS